MILLIDDKSAIPRNLEQALITEFPDFENQIDIWNPDKLSELQKLYENNKGNPEQDSAADEDIWRRVLEQRGINMVVVDHDLSELDVRISESAITNACKQLAIPVCNYHRKPPNNDSQNLKSRVNQARSFSIEIEIDEDNQYRQCAKEIINVFQGFQYLKERISNLEMNVLNEGPALDSLFTEHLQGSIFCICLFSKN